MQTTAATARIAACLVALALLASSVPALAQDTWSVVSPYVVWVTSTSRKDTFLGTGVIMAGGQILTAAHVIHPDRISVSVGRQGPSLSGTPATVLRVDRNADIAVLAAPLGYHGLRLVEIDPSPGEELWAFGYEFHRDQVPILRMARATVGQRFADFYQVDGAFQPGFSGGPLVTRGGRVAGILSATTTHNYNLAYMVPASRIASLLYARRPAPPARQAQPVQPAQPTPPPPPPPPTPAMPTPTPTPPTQPAQPGQTEIHRALWIYPGVAIGPVVLGRTTLQHAREALGPELNCTSGSDYNSCAFALPESVHRVAPEAGDVRPLIVVLFDKDHGTAAAISTNSTSFSLRDTQVRLGDHIRLWTLVLGSPSRTSPTQIRNVPDATLYEWERERVAVVVAPSGTTVVVFVY